MPTSTQQNEADRRRLAACELLTRRIQAERTTRLEDILAEHPELSQDDDALLDLILTEMRSRRGSDQEFTTAEWERRIPELIPDPRRRERLQSLLSTEMSTLTDSPRGPDAPPARDLSLRRGRIGRYHILGEIGRGGMGVVYKARQSNPGRTVAIKMILAGEHATARERARLRNEAETSARFRHSNIVQIIEADEHDGLQFLVMEYVEGGTLARMLRAMPQVIRWSVRLIETLARAIHIAHQAGIVHRDLNPTNILMTQDGTPKISDFGLAKSILVDQGGSLSGRILGTPSYMAPEQLSNGRQAVDSRTDVYALGAVLYEMLTGTPPFRGLTPMETLCQVAEGELVPPSKLRHGLPEDLETICLKCLERNPAARYPDAEALADDLRRFQKREPIQARRTSRLRRMRQWISREPLASALLFLSFFLLASLLIVSAVYSYNHKELFDAAVQKEGERMVNDYKQEIQQQRIDQRVDEALRREYVHQLGRIHDNISRNEPEVAMEAFSRLAQGAAPSQSRGFEWNYLDSLVHRSARVLTGEASHRAPVSDFTASPDGRTLLTGDADGLLIAWSLDAEPRNEALTQANQIPVRALATAGDAKGRATWHAAVRLNEDGASVGVWNAQRESGPWSFPEAIKEVAEVGFIQGGMTLAVRCRESEAAEWSVLVYHFVDGGWTRAEDSDLTTTTCAAFSKNTTAAAFGREDGSIVVVGVNDDGDLILKPEVHSLPTSLAWSQDGRKLATGWEDGRIILWNLPDVTPEREWRCVDGTPTALAFCRDEQALLAMEGTRRSLALHSLAKPGSRQVLMTPPGAIPTRMSVSPDGSRLAAGFDAQPVQLWNLNQPSDPSRSISHLVSPSHLLFSANGRSLFINFDQETVFAYDMEKAPHPLIRLSGHKAEAWSLSFSTDGRTLASGGDDQLIKLWDVASGLEIGSIPAHEQTVTSLAFAPGRDELTSVSLDGSWKVWRFSREDGPTTTARLELVHTLRPSGETQLRCVAYSHDGSLVAASGLTPDILVFDAPTYQNPVRIEQAHREMITALAFSNATEPALASVSCDRELRVWDPIAGDCIYTKWGSGALMSLAYSPPRQSNYSLLTASGDQRSIAVWGVSDYSRQDPPVRGHPAAIRSIAFSSNGAILATGCDDGKVRLCDVETRRVIYSLQGHHGRINAVAFSHDDSTLASCSHSGEVLLWKAHPPAR